jgi:hypothetical protein
MDINDITIGQMVALPTGEHGRVTSIDHDENVVWVEVATATGIDAIDMDPSELEPRS